MNRRKVSNILRYVLLALGLLILFVFGLFALFPKMFTSYGLKEQFDPWLKASSSHILGTNDMGYDVYTELVYGTRDTLFVGLLSSVLSLILGICIGTLSTLNSFVGKIFDGLIQVFMMLPKTIIVIVLASFFSHSSFNLIILISLFTWVGIARNIKMKVMHIKHEQYIENLKIQGYSNVHISIFHILPNSKDVIVSRFLMGINSCIMLESTLSFLGMGDLYHPTWGTMMNFAFKRGALINGAYAYLFLPGVCVMLVSISFYFISAFLEENSRKIKE